MTIDISELQKIGKKALYPYFRELVDKHINEDFTDFHHSIIETLIGWWAETSIDEEVSIRNLFWYFADKAGPGNRELSDEEQIALGQKLVDELVMRYWEGERGLSGNDLDVLKI